MTHKQKTSLALTKLSLVLDITEEKIQELDKIENKSFGQRLRREREIGIWQGIFLAIEEIEKGA